MHPEIITLSEKKVAGIRTRMSLAGDRTRALWQQFMPRRREIGNAVGTELYSVEWYDPQYFEQFDPEREFEKWAAVEVTGFGAVPEGLETITIPAGLYAVFLHKGTARDAAKTYQSIFGTWLPNAPYLLDHRPHMAVMGAAYKNDDPDSEETIWIPVKPKNAAGSESA
jgi:AraC family transcriptional regulator